MKSAFLISIFALFFCSFLGAQQCVISTSQIAYNYHTGSAANFVFQSSIGGFIAEGDCNSLDYSSILTIYSSTTGFEKLKELVHLDVYPNPVSDKFVASWKPLSFRIQYTLVDIDGQVVRQGSIEPYVSKQEFSVDDLTGGVYFLRLFGQKNFSISKSITKIN